MCVWEEEEVGDGGVEGMDVGEAGGEGGVGQGPNGGDVGVQVGEERMGGGGAGRQADGSEVTRLGGRPPRRQREGDGSTKAWRHFDGAWLLLLLLLLLAKCVR
jgi:hypothetical protein